MNCLTCGEKMARVRSQGPEGPAVYFCAGCQETITVDKANEKIPTRDYNNLGGDSILWPEKR